MVRKATLPAVTVFALTCGSSSMGQVLVNFTLQLDTLHNSEEGTRYRAIAYLNNSDGSIEHDVTIVSPDQSVIYTMNNSFPGSFPDVNGSWTSLQEMMASLNGTWTIYEFEEFTFDLAIDFPRGFPIVQISNPVHNGTMNSVDPVFSWTGSAEFGQQFLRLSRTSPPFDYFSQKSLSEGITQSWAPGVNLEPEKSYRFEAQAYSLNPAWLSYSIGAPETAEGNAWFHTLAGEISVNSLAEASFTVIPEPNGMGMAVLCATGAAWRLLRARHGPIKKNYHPMNENQVSFCKSSRDFEEFRDS